MIGEKIQNGFIDFSKIDFKCPHCGRVHKDDNDKYLNRCNRNKTGITRIKCDCGDSFYMTYDMTGDAVAFTKQ